MMGRMSDLDIEKQEELKQEELEQQDLDEQQQAIAELNPKETIAMLKKSGLKLVFNDKDLEKMVKIMEKSKNDTKI
jgi:hypothetical protein